MRASEEEQIEEVPVRGTVVSNDVGAFFFPCMPKQPAAYRTLKFRALATAALNDILNADLSIPYLFLASAE